MTVKQKRNWAGIALIASALSLGLAVLCYPLAPWAARLWFLISGCGVLMGAFYWEMWYREHRTQQAIERDRRSGLGPQDDDQDPLFPWLPKQ